MSRLQQQLLTLRPGTGLKGTKSSELQQQQEPTLMFLHRPAGSNTVCCCLLLHQATRRLGSLQRLAQVASHTAFP